MKKITGLLVLMLFLINNLSAQDEPKLFQVNFFPSIHIGGFYPEDINSYIEDDLSNFSMTTGTSDIFLNFNLGIGLGFRFANLVEVQPIVEYSLAPKIIIVSGESNRSYNFNKLSSGIMANFLIPISYNRKHSILIGAGILRHSLEFEDFSGNTIDPRAQIGFSLNNNKFNPQILLSADFAKTESEEIENFELDYTSYRVGVNLNF